MSGTEASAPPASQGRAPIWYVFEALICGIFLFGTLDPRMHIRIPCALALGMFVLLEIGIHLSRNHPSPNDARFGDTVAHDLDGRVVIPEGRPEAVYRTASNSRALVYLGLGLIFAGLAGWLWWGHLNGAMIVQGKAAMLLWLAPPVACVLFYMAARVLFGKLIVVVYPQGFAYATGNRVDFCAWDSIETIWHKVTRNQNGLLFASYWVRCDDGRHFTFKSDRLENIVSFGPLLRERVVPRLLDAAIETYELGEPVVFGPISVSKDGIVHRSKSIRWDEVLNIENDADGDFVVRKRGKLFAWCEVSTACIPNFPVLQGLLGDLIQVVVPEG